MHASHLLIVLFASALAIEDVEREALGAPGPTRANLRRGLKFGHFATEVEDEATDPPAPSPTFAATNSPSRSMTENPAPAPTPAAGGGFADTQDCADCPDCEVVDPYAAGYNFEASQGCICYVGDLDGSSGSTIYFSLSAYDDCIAITEFKTARTAIFIGGNGDDIIVAAESPGTVLMYGGEGYDECVGIDAFADCETGGL